MSDTDPDLISEVRIEQRGNDAHIIFVCNSPAKAGAMVENLSREQKRGSITLTIAGKPLNDVEE